MTNLIEIIESGKFNGLGKPDRVIETLISKLFFFDDFVYKVYKYNKAFFGNFSDDRFRHEFYHNDFTWNNTMAPDIYLKLGYVKNDTDTVIETTHDSSEDYYILMRKIDDSQTLLKLIRKNSLQKSDLDLITREMFKRLEKLTEIKRTDMEDLFDMTYVDLELQNMESTREWLYMASDFISKTEIDSLVEKLKAFIQSNPFFKNFDKNSYLACIDNHGGNILFAEGKVNFIDSMPPMRIWRIQSDAYSISRPATDFEVLLSKEYADVMFAEFEKVRHTKLDSKVRAYLQTAAALIQAPYLYILKEPEDAQKFWNFAKNKILELN